MTASPAMLRPPISHSEQATLAGQTMALVAATAGCFALGAHVARDASAAAGWWVLLAALGTLIALQLVARRAVGPAVVLLLVFGYLMGTAVAPTLVHHAGSDPGAVWASGAAAALFVAGIGSAAYGTRRDLTAVGRASWWGLVVLLVLGVVLLFVQLPGGSVVYSGIGLVVFAGLTAYDFNRLRRLDDLREAPLLAVSIFLDLLNVFLLLLSLFSRE